MKHKKEIDPSKNIRYSFLDGASNVKLVGILLKSHYTKLRSMRGIEHIVLLFSNDFLKVSIVHQIISSLKMIYKVFGYGIYHKRYSIVKPKYQEFHNKNIGLFSGNDTRISGYFMKMHRDLQMCKVLQSTMLSAEFISIPTNTKFEKQLDIFMIISNVEGSIYLLTLLFFVLEFFPWKIVTMQEWEKSIMTKECIEKNL